MTINPSYAGERPDIIRVVPPDAARVLDVGCSTGVVGIAIKRATGATVVGIEPDDEMASIAIGRLDQVLVGEVEDVLKRGALDDVYFDTIIFADVLEHLKDPWSVMKSAVDHLERDGVVIASIPNVRHIDTLFNLGLKGVWPYRDRGIHDRGHLRFFTKKTARDLFASAGLEVDLLRANYRLFEKPYRLNAITKYLAVPGLRDFLAFQYILRGGRRRDRS